MAAYSLRHYGEATYVLSHPRVIVEHYTETATAEEAYNTFAPDVRDSEFGELPNTCAHFLVEANGRIDQLVPLWLRCRHTVGLNWTAIGIEHVGFSDQEILHRPSQLAASLVLTRWLRCRYGIQLTNVIGHNESLSSRYHRERKKFYSQAPLRQAVDIHASSRALKPCWPRGGAKRRRASTPSPTRWPGRMWIERVRQLQSSA